MPYRQDLFLETVRQLRSGKTQDELSQAVNELVNDCRNTGKAGELVLKIKINPDKGGNGQYFLSDEVVVKRPKYDRSKTLMFGTPEGNLQRTDPNQGELPLRSVSDPVATVKTITEQTQTAKAI